MTTNASALSALEKYAEELALQGIYASKEDAFAALVGSSIRQAARLLDLKDDIEKGLRSLDSGQGVPADDVFAALKERARRRETA